MDWDLEVCILQAERSLTERPPTGAGYKALTHQMCWAFLPPFLVCWDNFWNNEDWWGYFPKDFLPPFHQGTTGDLQAPGRVDACWTRRGDKEDRFIRVKDTTFHKPHPSQKTPYTQCPAALHQMETASGYPGMSYSKDETCLPEPPPCRACILSLEDDVCPCTDIRLIHQGNTLVTSNQKAADFCSIIWQWWVGKGFDCGELSVKPWGQLNHLYCNGF